MPMTQQKLSAIAKKQSDQKKKNEPPPAWLGLIDVIFTVAMAGVKLPWEVGTKKGQVGKNSPPNSNGYKWRSKTKDLKVPSSNMRAMSWNAEDVTWASITGDGTPNALTLREAFESTNYYNRQWQELMRDRTVINSISFQTSDGTKITRAQAFALNDLVNDMPDQIIDPPEAADDDTALDI